MNCPTCGSNDFGVKSPNIILVERNEQLETENKRLREALDYAYPTKADYEEITGISVNDAFRIGWDMARTTNAMLTALSHTECTEGRKDEGEVEE